MSKKSNPLKREIIISVSLHLTVILLALFMSPISFTKNTFEYGEVIKINAVSMPGEQTSAPEEIPVEEPVTIPEPTTPQPLVEDLADIPIDDPKSIEDEKPIEKPKEEPKEKPKDKPKQTKRPTGETTEEPKKSGSEDTEITSQQVGQGSPFAGATIDNADFDYPYWFRQAGNKILNNFRKTVSIDGSVVVVVYFQVIKSGRMIELRIEQSSGIESIDRDCLAAFERSAPFPPLPSEFRSEIIGITIPIKY